jgi:signal transduction histidine kinase
MPHRRRLAYVPLFSRDRLEGVLAIAVGPANDGLRDTRLLGALGLVMGLALDNCRLYEGQRAHADHLRELNHQKSDFLGMVSHELRTPLTSIMMAAEILMEDEAARSPQSDRGRLVRSIVRGAARLTTLVTDLGHISREDEFQPRLELDEMAVSDVVANAVTIVQPLLTAKGQSLNVQLAGDADVVMADRLRFEQVLINLLSNAQRYSPPGGRVDIGTWYEGDEIVIYVSDCGPGVPREDRERVFEPFYRGDRTGMGLGLAISRSLVDRHGGRIWVEDAADGQGSVFCVALPLCSASHSARAASPVTG